MKYFIQISGQTHQVSVEGGHVVVDGQSFEAHLAAIPGTPMHHLLLGGESWTVAAQRLDEGAGDSPVYKWALGAAGERLEVEVVDERTRQIQALTGDRRPAPAGGTIKAPMPGLVIRIEVTAGQRVEAGAGLVVVEAMKMENELRATRAGVVKTIHVTVGQAVEKGAALVTMDAESRIDLPPQPNR